MKFTRHTFAPLVLLSYVLGGVLVEMTHHDAANILLRSMPVMETHTCGANEIHAASENARHCLACSHFAQRLSTQASNFAATDASNIIFGSLSSPTQQTLDIDVLHSGKRGPPSSLRNL